MKRTATFLLLIVITATFMFTGFQCGTAEMTSAKLYIQRSEWENAKIQLQKEIAKHPENAEAWYLLGQVFHEQKSYKEMVDAFNSSLKINNQFKKEIDNYKLSVWANNLNKGVDHYNKAIQMLQTSPDSADTHFNTALDYLNIAVAAQPDSATNYRVLALCYYGMRDMDNAIVFLKKTLDKQFDVQLGRMLGGIYYDRAIVAKNNAATVEGDEKKKILEIANKNLNETIKILEATSKVTPEDPNVLAALNDAYIAAGRTEEALNSYKVAIKTDPTNKLAHYNYGVLLLRAGNHAEAASQFDETVNLDTNFTDAIYNAAAAYMQWGAKMREQAEAAIQNDKTKQIDKAFEEKFRKAKTYLDKLVELTPNDISAWETLGMANAILNIPKEAKAAYDKADSLRKTK
ncbi:MAG: tetratricopeptide repeat protein [Bacteroidetes bacterium]|nr:tetratricopeptide repeat protein [Bacteroidota bacterium]MBU1423911.1 tetratricopeptide repeat protein [Bacteroidota bacterium]MBU2472248.1 tetratricopeptide repeat protein [Bacteroidota bacterium]MBU2637188.1 tetratricopeptide repeat protein [Bacteroidota bacterium]